MEAKPFKMPGSGGDAAGGMREVDTILRLKMLNEQATWQVFDGLTRDEMLTAEPVFILPVMFRVTRKVFAGPYVPGEKQAVVCASWDGDNAFGLGRRPENPKADGWKQEVCERVCAECPSSQWGSGVDDYGRPKMGRPGTDFDGQQIGRLCEPVLYGLVMWSRGELGDPWLDLRPGFLTGTGAFSKQMVGQGRRNPGLWAEWESNYARNGLTIYRAAPVRAGKGVGIQAAGAPIPQDVQEDVVKEIEKCAEYYEGSIARGQAHASKIGSDKPAGPLPADRPATLPEKTDDRIPF
jgi:hypothetical protein